MSTDTPAVGGDDKPNVKIEGNRNQGGRSNVRRNNNYIKKEKFLGAHPSLQGHVFEAKRNRSEQVANYRNVDETIKAQIGADYDPYVLESLEKDTMTLPDEPTAVYTEKQVTTGTGDEAVTSTVQEISDIEMLKFKTKYTNHVKRVESIENQTKQAYSVYFGQIDDEMKASIKQNPDYERAHNEKDVFALRRMLREVNFNYRRTEEPIKTLVTATKDMFLLRQNDSSLQEYYEKFQAMRKVVEELSSSDHGNPLVDIICRETNKDPASLSSDEKQKMIDEGGRG